ncbi:MAG: hypothetical protein NT011_08750 [Kiritimatiellaeota bacterium]|nr:hypothetical protein [Kiritimatiellota bacterium]
MALIYGGSKVEGNLYFYRMNANMESTGKSLKSALDLAMERLAQRDGAPAKLTNAQKAALAEVDRKTKAKLAEREILGSDHLAKAGDDPEKIEPIKVEQRAEIKKIKSRAEEEKERIRKGAAS